MTPQDQQQQNLQSIGGDTVREQDKIMIVLAYLGILALIPFLTVKDSDFVKWHAKQGLVLGGVAFGLGLISSVLSVIPVVNLLVCPLGCALFVAFLVAAIMGITKGLAGERYRLPVLADIADKF